MNRVSDVFAVWPTDADLGRDIGISYPTVSAWKQRGSIPAPYWRDVIRAARRRGHPEVTAELLVDLHAREETSGVPGFAEEERAFGAQTDIARPNKRASADKATQHDAGHFSRFRDLRSNHFRTAAEIEEHVNELRDEWSHR
jgi:hypothetical protein